MKTANISRVRPLRWTVEQYDRLTEQGFFRKARVELIEGRIIQMPAQKEPHMLGVMLAQRALTRVFGDEDYYVRPPGPIRQGRRSKPEPDVAVVVGNPRLYVQQPNPAGALLVIEVSDTTLRYDRGRKASLYSKHGIADYWIVNLIDSQLEVHRDPVRDSSNKWGFHYESIQILKAHELVSPLAMPYASIPVKDLLP